jgi:hypothetical protein
MDELDKKIIEAYDSVIVDEQYKDVTEIMNVDNAFDNVMERRSDMLIAINSLETALSKIPASELGKKFSGKLTTMRKNNHSLKKELQHLQKAWGSISKTMKV